MNGSFQFGIRGNTVVPRGIGEIISRQTDQDECQLPGHVPGTQHTANHLPGSLEKLGRYRPVFPPLVLQNGTHHLRYGLAQLDFFPVKTQAPFSFKGEGAKNFTAAMQGNGAHSTVSMRFRQTLVHAIDQRRGFINKGINHGRLLIDRLIHHQPDISDQV